MKILLLQLARFGDIFQTWPTIHALKRNFPDCEIHILVRSKFESAIALLPQVDRIWTLDSEKIIRTLIDGGFYASVESLNSLVHQLSEQGFDQVINLTFSNFSGFLTTKISSKTKRGYVRFRDGTPTFADSYSKYFYSQTGVGESNQIHVCDLFAKVAGTELCNEDWNFKPLFQRSQTGRYVAIHLGASHPKKCLPIHTWSEVVDQLVKKQVPIKLIGNKDEIRLAEYILDRTPSVDNLVGKTTFKETFEIVASASVFAGCDSSPLQIASLMGTPALNLSFATVNYWETGPKSSGSRILFETYPSQMKAERVADGIYGLYDGQVVKDSIEVKSPTSKYISGRNSSFESDLVRLIYFSGECPVLNEIDRQILNILKACVFELERGVNVLRKGFNQSSMDRINLSEQKIESLKNTRFRPLIFWFEAEKIMIPPSDFMTAVVKTQNLYLTFKNLILKIQKANKEFLSGSDQVDPTRHLNPV